MGTISLDYESVRNEINRLREIASELQTLQNDAQRALGDINDYWEGAAADAFSAASEQWRGEIRTIEEEISSLAELIQRVADEIRDAEMRALEAIQNAGGTG